MGSEEIVLKAEISRLNDDVTRLDHENHILQSLNGELVEALKRFMEYGDCYQYRNGDRSPYAVAKEILAKAEKSR